MRAPWYVEWPHPERYDVRQLIAIVEHSQVDVLPRPPR
jgi:hypothetical protein